MKTAEPKEKRSDFSTAEAKQKNSERILVIAPTWIGDAVMSLPAVNCLRHRFANAEITILAREWAAPIFLQKGIEGQPIAERVLRVARNENLPALAGRVRGFGFDFAVIFPNAFRWGLLAWLAKIPNRIGLSGQYRRFLLTKSESAESLRSLHQMQRYLRISNLAAKGSEKASSDEIGICSDDLAKIARTKYLEPSANSIELANEILMQAGLREATEKKRGYIVIGPGSANSEAKRWPQNYFSSVCDSLSSKMGLPIVLLGSQSEISVCAEVRLGCKKEVYDLSGKTSLEQTIAIASNAALVISNDMGLAHIAAASGAPTLTIFGPTDEKITRPIGQKAEIIRESVECSPCMLRQCPIDHRCMQRLRPERIFEAAMKMLK